MASMYQPVFLATTGCQPSSGYLRGFLWLRGKDLRGTVESNSAAARDAGADAGRQGELAWYSETNG